MILSFGRHAGKQLEQIPRGYLRWLLANANNMDSSLKQGIIRVLRGLPSGEYVSLEEQAEAVVTPWET